jgi:hypothetical protein
MFRRHLAGGLIADLVGTSIKVGQRGTQFYDEVWDFRSLPAAIAALLSWNQPEEPLNWCRHSAGSLRRYRGYRTDTCGPKHLFVPVADGSICDYCGHDEIECPAHHLSESA